jgi:cbb3-type cytochrome oxidase maturation protein
MSVIVLLIVAGGTVAAGFLAAFAWAVQSGQFDDTCTPAVRVLLEDGANHAAGPFKGLRPSTTLTQSVSTQEGQSHADSR